MDSFFIKSSVNEQESSAIYDILSKFFTSALLNKMEKDLRNKEANTPKLLTGKKTTRY
jgi:hypothetical protein